MVLTEFLNELSLSGRIVLHSGSVLELRRDLLRDLGRVSELKHGLPGSGVEVILAFVPLQVEQLLVHVVQLRVGQRLVDVAKLQEYQQLGYG